MQREENYSRLFREADKMYISDDQKRVYNLILTDYLTATRLQVYELETRKRTFIEFRSSYTHDFGYWFNGKHYNSKTVTPYYYPEFISIYVKDKEKYKEVGSGSDLPAEVWSDMMEIVNENFEKINMKANHLYGRSKKHRVYEANNQELFQLAQ